MLDSSLKEALVAFCRHERVLIVSDFDGTLAGFNIDPDNVPVHQQSIRALTTLADAPFTNVALLSGRDLASLARNSRLGDPVLLAGSHGIESNLKHIQLTEAQKLILDSIAEKLDRIIDGHPGAFVEVKPFHRVIHVRGVQDPVEQDRLLAKALEIQDEGLDVTPGKCIVEFCVTPMTKGAWLDTAREQLGADAVFYVGDDVTDENAFAHLKPGDVGVKVGDGKTLAEHRVSGIEEVGELFEYLTSLR